MAHRRNVVIAFGMAVAGQAVAAVTPLVERLIIDDGIVAQTAPVWPWLVLLLAAGAFSFCPPTSAAGSAGGSASTCSTTCATPSSSGSSASTSPRHDELQTGQLVSRASLATSG